MISEKSSFSLSPSVSAFKQIREGLSLSRKEFAEILGVNSDTVGLWETSKSIPALDIAQVKQLDKLLQKLGLNWQDLPDHIGDPNIPPPKRRRAKKGLQK